MKKLHFSKNNNIINIELNKTASIVQRDKVNRHDKIDRLQHTAEVRCLIIALRHLIVDSKSAILLCAADVP